MEEIWKDIKGYEGLYQVSNLGRVKSLNYRRGGEEKILKFQKSTKGYLQIRLFKNGEAKCYKVHRLVAKAFIDNLNNYPCINHIDECKTNNNINNLEWCTSKYNANYGTRNKRMIENKSIPIYCLETNKFYKSATESAKELNINQRGIVKVLKRRCKQYKGYTFRYANQILFIGGK